MRVIREIQYVKAIWGSYAPLLMTYPNDAMEYRHPVLGDAEPYLISCKLPLPFKRTPAEFEDLATYRKAWKEHRDAQPTCAMILDEYMPGFGVTVLFDETSEFTGWLARQRAKALELGEEMKLRRQNAGSEVDAALSFRRFSGAVKRAGLSYPASVLAIYDTLFSHRRGEHKPRHELAPAELAAVKEVESVFARSIYEGDIRDAESGETLLRQAAMRVGVLSGYAIAE